MDEYTKTLYDIAQAAEYGSVQERRAIETILKRRPECLRMLRAYMDLEPAQQAEALAIFKAFVNANDNRKS